MCIFFSQFFVSQYLVPLPLLTNFFMSSSTCWMSCRLLFVSSALISDRLSVELGSADRTPDWRGSRARALAQPGCSRARPPPPPAASRTRAAPLGGSRARLLPPPPGWSRARPTSPGWSRVRPVLPGWSGARLLPGGASRAPPPPPVRWGLTADMLRTGFGNVGG